jgi:hypothetical protein
MNESFVAHFSKDWIESWNEHNLDRILSHYTDDFEMNSPVITQITGNSEGKLKGKKAVGEYWQKALKLIPDLHFESICTLVGTNSITLHYKGAKGKLSAEVFLFNDDGLVHTAYAHYAI